MGRSGLSSNTWFLGPTRVLKQNGISSGSAVLQGSLLGQTNRQTDRQTPDKPRYSVCNDIAAPAYVVLRCGLIIGMYGHTGPKFP